MSKVKEPNWLNAGHLPFRFALVTSKAEWRWVQKDVGHQAKWQKPTGAITWWFNHGGHLTVLVAVNPKADEEAALKFLVHEAVHVWQNVRKHIGEHEPSKEFEAYTVDGIFVALWEAWKEKRAA